MEKYNLSLRKGSHEDIPELVCLWRRSVEATHAFLTAGDIDGLQPQVGEGLGLMEVWIVEADGVPAAFMGMSGDMIEALFVDPRHMGKRIGTLLIAHARELRGKDAYLKVDVNEQNPGAAAFYRKCGFVQTGRSETDSAGRPWPLLHMILR